MRRHLTRAYCMRSIVPYATVSSAAFESCEARARSDRPPRPDNPVKLLEQQYAGREVSAKLEDLRKELDKKIREFLGLE